MKENINSTEFFKKLKENGEVKCPKCHKGKVITKQDPKTSHYFHCDNCDFQVNIN